MDGEKAVTNYDEGRITMAFGAAQETFTMGKRI
jgi:hypothetical protein